MKRVLLSSVVLPGARIGTGPRSTCRYWPSAPGSPNPYIVGNAKALNFLKVAEECAMARMPEAN